MSGIGLSSFSPRFYTIDVALFELSEFLPIGVVTLLALPSAGSQVYIRHLTAVRRRPLKPVRTVFCD